MTDQPRSSTARVDWSAVVSALTFPLFFWVLAILLVAMFGYPGVVCITPLGWLLALVVGLRLARGSNTTEPGLRFRETALAGGILGLAQGLLFLLVLVIFPVLPLAAGERAGALLIGLLVLVVGTLACAALALLIRRAGKI